MFISLFQESGDGLEVGQLDLESIPIYFSKDLSPPNEAVDDPDSSSEQRTLIAEEDEEKEEENIQDVIDK